MLKKTHGTEWSVYLNERLCDIQDIHFDQAAGELIWRGDRFSYLDFAEEGCSPRCLMLKRVDRKELLFKSALDSIQDGVQIYNSNAELVYMNKASRRISDIPNHMEVEGRHLIDLYDLEEDISTTMTCLRTTRPVINRFDNFKSTGGSTIISINTAYPIFDDDELVGAVVFEQNLSSINDQIQKMEEMKDTIKAKTSMPMGKFNGYRFSDLIGKNPDFTMAVMLARKIAAQHCNVLLVGETGTGKEIFAQSIHKASDRKNKKFVAINCAAVPETLIESMFFGTSKGSFTGSVDKPGLLEEASGGVLFLDELNSMSLSMQSKLLRVIQEGSFRRVGSSQDIQADVRFISSCNEQPSTLIEKNVLRKDLFYRLSTVTIDIPPLRDRADDIEELVRFYLARHISRYAKSVHSIGPEVIPLFEKYHWPGNVRELFNVLDYVLNTIEGDVILARHLPKTFHSSDEVSAPLVSSSAAFKAVDDESGKSVPAELLSNSESSAGLAGIMRSVEQRVIEKTLIECRYNVTRAAAKLQLSRQNLQYRIKKLGIEL
ncbi:transcriptional regulator [Deltaproteobacteria bacterium Smac51]|nr:transcriptional regulator [Deltaproteobacteria bacterium Smac51]